MALVLGLGRLRRAPSSPMPFPGAFGIYWLCDGGEQVLSVTSHCMIQKVVFHRSPAGCSAVEEYSSTYDLRSTPCLHSHGNCVPKMMMWWHFNPGGHRALCKGDTVMSLCWKFPDTLKYRMLCNCLYMLCASWCLAVQSRYISISLRAMPRYCAMVQLRR